MGRLQSQVTRTVPGMSIDDMEKHFADTLRVGRPNMRDEPHRMVGMVALSEEDKENYDERNDNWNKDFGKPILPSMKCRSLNAIMRAENDIEAIDRKIRLIEEQRLSHETRKNRERRD